MWVDPKHFLTVHQPQKLPIGAPNAKPDPKISSKQKFRLQGSIRINNFSAEWGIDHKNYCEPYPNPKNGPLEP